VSEYTLHLGDCLDILPTLESGSVDLIAADLPYGTTACAWDEIIPLAPMWEQVRRVLKPRGTFLTTACQPFTSLLMMSNLEMFKQELIWQKGGNRGAGFTHAKNYHLKFHENILVFSSGIIAHNGAPNRMTYNPQGLKPYNQKATGRRKDGSDKGFNHGRKNNGHGLSRPSHKLIYEREFTNYPNSIIDIPLTEELMHPTQKPVALYEYLIRTYSNPGDTVLDFCFGSGTTIVAALNTWRNAIGIERDPDYFKLAQRRIEQASRQQPLFAETADAGERAEQMTMGVSA